MTIIIAPFSLYPCANLAIDRFGQQNMYFQIQFQHSKTAHMLQILTPTSKKCLVNTLNYRNVIENTKYQIGINYLNDIRRGCKEKNC